MALPRSVPSLSGLSPPSPEFDFPPSLFIAIAIHSCASCEIEPYDIAPVLKRFTISLTGSTSSSGTGVTPSVLNSSSPLNVCGLRSLSTISVYSLKRLYEPCCVASRRAITVSGLYIWSSLSLPERSLCSPTLSSVVSTPSPSGSNAWLWRYSTPSLISSRPIPPTRLTVLVKYLSITSFLMPTASNICDDWYDCMVEIPILEAILTMPCRMALL